MVIAMHLIGIHIQPGLSTVNRPIKVVPAEEKDVVRAIARRIRRYTEGRVIETYPRIRGDLLEMLLHSPVGLRVVKCGF
jgi:hypothetical protein